MVGSKSRAETQETLIFCRGDKNKKYLLIYPLVHMYKGIQNLLVMNIQQKFDELCFHIESTELSCDVILDYKAVIKSWNLPYGEEILEKYCRELADDVNDRYWGINRKNSFFDREEFIKQKNLLALSKRGIIADLVGDGY